MKLKYALIILLFIFCVESSLAKETSLQPTVIYGKYHGAVEATVLQLRYYDYFFTFYERGNVQKITLPMNDEGSFSFQLPPLSHPGYFSIVINPGLYEIPVLTLYIFEAGDNIQILFDKNNISFSGRGAAKYQCRSEVDKMPKVDAQNDRSMIAFRSNIEAKKGNYFQFLIQDQERSDSMLAARLKLIDKYKLKLNPQIFALLKADYNGQKLADGFTFMRYYYNSAQTTDSAYSAFIDFYKKEYGNWSADTTNSQVLVLSKSYDEALIYYSKLNLRLKANNFEAPITREYTMKDLYGDLDLRYKGALKQRVLTGMMAEMFDYLDDSDEFLKKSLLEVNEKPWLKILKTIAGSQLRGTPVYPFSLQDSSGRVLHASDFKGKVVVIDFWYTGCGACRYVAKGLRHVVEHYKGDSNVAFLTISIDMNMEAWKNSLMAGGYTGPGEINMYTGTLGDQSAVIRYYNIEGFPKVIIVDKKGNIFSTHYSTPWDDDEERIRNFQNAIDEASKI